LTEEEDEWHIFFGCREFQQVWHDAGLRAVIDSRLHKFNNNVQSMFFDICSSEPVETAGAVAMVAWCLWYNRNNWIWNGLKDTAREIATKATHMLSEWRAVNILQRNSRNSS
jgi:hypothetical protein